MRVLITGATGQVAAYLAKRLLDRGDQVLLTDRHVSYNDQRFWRLEELGIQDDVEIVPCDLSCHESIFDTLERIRPDHLYHLAANSSIQDTTLDELACMQVNFGITHRLLSSYRKIRPDGRFFFMGSSEQFGNATESPQTELTAFHPRNPYGIAKAAAFELVRYYREHWGFFCCSAISYNQVSPLQGDTFVLRKITRGLIKALNGGPKLKLGNLDAERDFGSVQDYTRAIVAMLDYKEATDFVLATGKTHTIRQFLDEASAILSGLRSKFTHWEDLVKVDPTLLRAPEAVPLVGHAAKAWELLSWVPYVSFPQLVREMVEADWKRSDKS